MEIPDQNMIMNLNILAATIRSFKMLIDYTLDLTPPFSPCPQSLPQKKEKTKKLLLNSHLYWPMSSLQTPQANSFFWEQTFSLLIGICQLFKLFSSPPPPPAPPSPMLLSKSSHWPKLTKCEPCFTMSKES